MNSDALPTKGEYRIVCSRGDFATDWHPLFDGTGNGKAEGHMKETMDYTPPNAERGCILLPGKQIARSHTVSVERR